MALRTVGVRLMAEVAGYKAGLNQARASTRDFVGEMDKAAKAGKLDAVADQATALGLGLAGAFAVAVGAAAKFDKQMSEVGAVSNATGQDLEKLRQAALDAGADTAFSATEAAKAEAELAKAGLDTSQILGGALSGSLALAAAGSVDLAESADIAAKTMNVFKLEGRDVGHIADVLAASANKSATDVHEMGEALKQGGLAASAAGMSMEETVGTLSAFADRALVGSDAGTSLKTAIMFLQAPSDKAAAAMEELGLSAYDANGQFIGTTKLAGELQRVLGGLTQEQRNAALATIFGADGMRAANILYELGEKGIQDYVAAVDDQGAAADVAAKKMDNLAGDVEKLKGSLETMAIEAGSGANGGLRILTQSVGAVVDEVGQLPPVLGSTVTVMAGVAGGALLLGAGWIRVRRSTRDMLDELRQVGPGGQRAARGLETASKWAGRAAVAFVAFEVAGAAIGAMQDDLNPQIEALGKGLEEWGRGGRLAGESARLLGSDMADLNVGLKFLADTDNSRRKFARWGQELLEGVVPGLDGTNTSLTRTKERVDAMDQALSQLVQSGHADDAAGAFDRLAAEAAKDGVSVDELRKLFPAYAAAVEVAGKASGQAAGGIAEVGGAAGQSAEDVQKLTEAFDTLFERYMSIDEANLKYKQGIAELNEELTTGSRTLNDNKKAGQDNIGAILEQINRIKALRDARIRNNETLDVANGKYQKDIEGLRKTLYQLGYNKTAVDALIGKYKAIPDEVATDVKINDMATAKARAIREEIRKINGRTVVVAVKYETHGSVQGEHIIGQGTKTRRWGGITEHARDGLLREAGIYSPAGPARYAFAEPATQGEAFVPKNGDPARSLGILSKAAGWYGASLWPQSMAPVMAGGGGTLRLEVVARVEERAGGGLMREINRGIRLEVKQVGGGDVQATYGRQR